MLLLIFNSESDGIIVPFDATHAHTADEAIVLTAIVVPDDALHAHTADSPIVADLVRPDDALHTHTADSTSITTTTAVSPHEARHLHFADDVTIYTGDILEVHDHLTPTLSVGPLNACATYEVYVANRGGETLVCRLPNTATITYNRVLNDFSEARIDLRFDAACRDCLASTNPWQHEIMIFRSSQLVWCGPIVNIIYDPAGSTVSVHARDLTAWTEKRFIEIVGVDDYDVEDVDTREVFEWVLSHGYNKQPWNMTWSLHDTGIPITRFYPSTGGDQWGGSYKNVASELRALSKIGVDFTAVNRHLYGGDLELVPPIAQTLKISDKAWAVAPKINVNGTSMSTRTIVAGGSGGFYGWTMDQMWIEEETDSPYGLLESFTERTDLGDEDTTQTPNAITQEAYGRHRLLRQPIATLSEGQLAGDAPFTFDTLIPGVPIEVGLVNAVRPVEIDYRIYSVDVSASPENEVVNLKLSLPGASEIRE